MTRSVAVTLATGDVRSDWCDRCMTSAAIACNVFWLSDDGPHLVGSLWACTTCDPDKFIDGITNT